MNKINFAIKSKVFIWEEIQEIDSNYYNLEMELDCNNSSSNNNNDSPPFLFEKFCNDEFINMIVKESNNYLDFKIEKSNYQIPLYEVKY